jgi:dTDP-glucose pyrophosphorylase
MRSYKDHLISKGSTIKEALILLNDLGRDAILFIVDDTEKLIGSLTDGDIRRGLIKGLAINDSIDVVFQFNPKFLRKGENHIEQVINYRELNFKIIPILDKHDRIVNIINFREKRSYLPIDVVIMAGGRGERLRPFTDTTPKPLLKVGNKPIIEYNIDHLISYGVDDIWISVRYLGEQIEEYFKNGNHKGVNIRYLRENIPLGTIGAAAKAEITEHDYLLVINSDILTNINFEDFFLDFISKDAMLSIVTIPYYVNVPYAVLETSNEHVISFKEKPVYTYFSNGGIYLMKKECLKLIPEDTFFNTTDLMDLLIADKQKVVSYQMRDYWLDIGKYDDYEKAQEDVKHIKF